MTFSPLNPMDSLPALQQTPKIDTTKALDADDAALKEQTDQFEAIMINIMLDNAMKTENHLFPKETGQDMYESMYREELSKELAGGFGFSELLFNYLKEGR